MYTEKKKITKKMLEQGNIERVSLIKQARVGA